MNQQLLDEALSIGKQVKQDEELLEVSALKLNMQMDEIEKELPYFPKHQDRDSIDVVIDGVTVLIDKYNCDATIFELFTDVVYQRQFKSITQYLKNKHPDKSCLTKEQARRELIDLPLPSTANFFEFEEIATIIASDVVGR